MLPQYLKVSAQDLGKGTPVKVRILGDMLSVGLDLRAFFEAAPAQPPGEILWLG